MSIRIKKSQLPGNLPDYEKLGVPISITLPIAQVPAQNPNQPAQPAGESPGQPSAPKPAEPSS
jgi:hypothetical protein